jgi:hypothetical protein
VKVVVHDYSGHPGQVHLSRELARRGHVVEHQFCSSYTSGRGATDKRDADPDSFSVKAIALNTEFKRYNPIVRVRQEFQYARLSARAVLAARPDAVILSNIPLLAMLPLTWALRLRRVPYVLWWQDVYSDAIKTVSRQKLGPPGAFVGWVAQRFERQVAARARRSTAGSRRSASPTASSAPTSGSTSNCPAADERLREEQQAELEERCGLLDGVDQHPDADPERALVQVERRLMQVELRTAA